MCVSAGAMIVDTMIRLKPVKERTEVTSHLRGTDQSLGLLGSRGVSKATRKCSRLAAAGISIGCVFSWLKTSFGEEN
jgi:hypothetical protein